jgi:hypothetical protein
MPLNIDPESHDMPDFDCGHPDFDVDADEWKKCGACPTMLPVRPGQPGQYHRYLNGKELCSECTDKVTDAEQEAAEDEAARRTEQREWMAGGHA